jgi:hypothetical protein
LLIAHRLRRACVPQAAVSSWRRAVAAASLVALFSYLVVVRTWGVAETFWLLEDQERDWSEAMVSIGRLRMTGTPSHVGGNTFGPLWYWFLWCARHVIGPFTANMPHTGAIALAIFQSGADVALLVSLRRHTGSWWLAAGVVGVIATAPWDIALNAAMWSPEFSVALAKLTLALALASGRRPRLSRALAIAAAAWLTFQAHSTGVFIAVPVLAALVVVEWMEESGAAAMRRALVLAGVVGLLQVPFTVDLWRHPPDAVGPTLVLDSLAATIRHPAAIRLAATLVASGTAIVGTFSEPWTVPAAPWLLLAWCGAALWLYRDRLILAAATVVPVLAFILVFAAQQTPFDSYYILPLIPGAAVAAALVLRESGRAMTPAAVVLCVVVAFGQPRRVSGALTQARFPHYGALVRGSREIRKRTPSIQNIDAAFPLPNTTDPTYIYWVLGGRIDRSAPYSARIEENGAVTFTPAVR